jgi:hypothetical protein
VSSEDYSAAAWQRRFLAESGLGAGTHMCRCVLVPLNPGEQICTKDYPPDVAFHPARLARLSYGTPPPLVTFQLG